MTDTLAERARRVGDAVEHECDRLRGPSSDPPGDWCPACRAEAAALAELRALREQCIEEINNSEGDMDFALFKLRVLGEPAAEGKHE